MLHRAFALSALASRLLPIGLLVACGCGDDTRAPRASASAAAASSREVRPNRTQDGAAAAVPTPSAPSEHAVTGTVRRADSTPIAGARIELRRHDAGGRFEDVARGVADGAGAFVVGPADPAYEFEVRASAAGFVTDVKTAKPNGSVDFVLKPGAALTGRVLAAEDAAPVANAMLQASRDEKPSWSDEVVSGADGSYRFDGLPEGAVGIGVFPRGRSHVHVDVTATTNELRRDIFVPSGAVVTGVVLRDDHPVAGALVTDDAHDAMTTGADGVYLFEGVESGDQTISVTAPGLEEQSFSVQVPVAVARISHDLVIEPGWAVHGKVVQGDAPVASARVSTTWKDCAETGAWATVTNADGTFTLRSGWVPGYKIVALAPDGNGAQALEIKTPQDSRTVDVVIRLEPQVEVHGRVRDEQGAPVARANVDILERSPNEPMPDHQTVCDDEGRFAAKLPAVTWQFTVAADGFVATAETHDLHPGKTAKPEFEIVLARGGDVTGLVTDPHERPVAGANVYAWGDCGSSEATTDADGRYRLRRLPDADVRVRVACPGYAADSSFEIKKGERTKDFIVEPESVVEGVVVGPDGVSAARVFTVRLYMTQTSKGEPWDSPWPFREETFNDAAGRFAVAGVEPGTIEIEASSGAMIVPRRESVKFEDGHRRADVRLVLAPAARIAGRVVDSTGTALEGVRLQGGITSPEDQHSDELEYQTDREGRFEFGGLPAGRYVLAVNGVPEPFRDREIRFDVAPGESITRDVVLHRPGRIAVSVVDSDGSAIADATVDLHDAEGLVSYTEYSPASIVDDDLEPGRFTVHANAEGYVAADATVDVAEGKTVAVRVTLRRK